VHSFLVQGADDPALWRVVTVWHSRDALAAYRRSVEVAGGVLMFRAVGAEPVLAIFDVAVHTG
jgi:heme-degrading monooxygenase HmoA